MKVHPRYLRILENAGYHRRSIHPVAASFKVLYKTRTIVASLDKPDTSMSDIDPRTIPTGTFVHYKSGKADYILLTPCMYGENSRVRIKAQGNKVYSTETKNLYFTTGLPLVPSKFKQQEYKVKFSGPATILWYGDKKVVVKSTTKPYKQIGLLLAFLKMHIDYKEFKKDFFDRRIRHLESHANAHYYRLMIKELIRHAKKVPAFKEFEPLLKKHKETIEVKPKYNHSATVIKKLFSDLIAGRTKYEHEMLIHNGKQILITPNILTEYDRIRTEPLQHKKHRGKSVKVTDRRTGESKTFINLGEASKYMGYGSNYLSTQKYEGNNNNKNWSWVFNV